MFSLAEHLHKTVGELMEQMTPEELQLWVGYLTRQHEVQEEAERRASRRR